MSPGQPSPSDAPTLSPALRAIAASFPEGFLSTDPEVLSDMGRDWTRRFEPRPCGVAFPRSTDDVAKLVTLCRQHHLSIVPSGGRTGLSGGAVAASGELVVSLGRMNRIFELDPVGRTLRVEAGVVTESVHAYLEPHGLTWPVDFASKGSSQVGGNIATNAGGLNVIRYGHTRNWVLGIKVVTASGEILELNGALEKNNSGLDLRQLFIGTEGTLGIITEATLKLEKLPSPTQIAAFLFGVSGLDGALALLLDARGRGPFRLRAFEIFTPKCLRVVMKHRQLSPPISTEAGGFVLMEIERDDDPSLSPLVDIWLEEVLANGLALDGVVSRSAQERRQLWAFRESITESIGREGLVHKNDVSVPVARLASFTRALETFFTKTHPELDPYIFGHLGDGNLHINVVKPGEMAKEAFELRCRDIDEQVYRIIKSERGSLSAEHGIGLIKKPYLGITLSEAELRILRLIKSALDPEGLLNPGKIFD